MCDVRPDVCKHFGYLHGDRVLHEHDLGTMWLTVIGVWGGGDGPALLLWKDGDSGAGTLSPLPPDMLVLKRLPAEEVRSHLGCEPPRAFNLQFPFMAGCKHPVVRLFDNTAAACEAFGFRAGDVVKDKQENQYTVIGVGPLLPRKCFRGSQGLWALRDGSNGAERLQVSRHVSLVSRGSEKPQEYGPLGALECTLIYPLRAHGRAGQFDVRPEICCKLAGVPRCSGLQHGTQVEDRAGRRFTLIGARYHRGCPRLWFERDGKTGATLFAKFGECHVKALSLPPRVQEVHATGAILPMARSLDWDEVLSDDSDEEPERDLERLLREKGGATSKSELIKLLESAARRHKHRKQHREPEKLLCTTTLNRKEECNSKPVRESDGIKHGMRVRSRSNNCIGVVTNIDSDGTFRIESLKETGQGVDTWHAQRQDIERDERADLVRPGALVQVRAGIECPRFEWGFLTPSDIGVVRAVEDGVVSVNFGQRKLWKGALDEFQVLEPFDCLQVGSHVQLVKPDLKPRYGLGELKTTSAIGVVSRMDGEEICVNFPEADDWKLET